MLGSATLAVVKVLVVAGTKEFLRTPRLSNQTFNLHLADLPIYFMRCHGAPSARRSVARPSTPEPRLKRGTALVPHYGPCQKWCWMNRWQNTGQYYEQP